MKSRDKRIVYLLYPQTGTGRIKNSSYRTCATVKVCMIKIARNSPALEYFALCDWLAID